MESSNISLEKVVTRGLLNVNQNDRLQGKKRVGGVFPEKWDLVQVYFTKEFWCKHQRSANVM